MVTSEISNEDRVGVVLDMLKNIIDPDVGDDIVTAV
jgi:hypothetical protein